MKNLFPLLFCAFATTVAFAQPQPVHRCATHEVFEQNATRNPGYAAAVEHAFNYAQSFAQNRAAFKAEEDTVFRIPVVVHIVYNTTGQNIDDSLVYSQIEVLNQDYRRLNADTGNTRDVFKPVAADAGIEFFLATEDPQGNPTTGITRTHTDTTFFSVIGNILSGDTSNGADLVKKTATGGIDAWDTDNYLNIWVCNLEDPNSFFGLVLGFSYPPDNAPNWPAEAFPADSSLHGLVIHYKVFGRNNPLAVPPLDMATRGRTVVHEVGHFLGLRHIWGDGPLSIIMPDCSVDDGIGDTPNSGNNSQQAGCDTTKNTCTEGSPDLPDMFENYMDYSREECQNIFTQGQVAIMRAMLSTSRSELPVSEAPSAIHAAYSEIEMSIYPNPADGEVRIHFPQNANVHEITVSDLLGKTQQQFRFVSGNDFTLDLSALPSGIYTVTALSESGRAVRKVLLD